jgi:hypothetical protein
MEANIQSTAQLLQTLRTSERELTDKLCRCLNVANGIDDAAAQSIWNDALAGDDPMDLRGTCSGLVLAAPVEAMRLIIRLTPKKWHEPLLKGLAQSNLDLHLSLADAQFEEGAMLIPC